MSKKLNEWLNKAQGSSSALMMLNWALKRGIPFNKPHGIKIQALEDNSVTTIIPYKRRNWNHIKGTHACGLATAAEFAAGLLLMRSLDASKYRLIMRELKVQYHYQAKEDCLAKAEIHPEVLAKEVVQVLEHQEKVFHTVTTELHDVSGNHLATATTEWQIKRWDKVKTKA